MTEPFLSTNTSDVSGRTAIVAEEMDSFWLYLTGRASPRIECDCWLFNTPAAPADPDMETYRARSAPPPAPVDFITAEGVRQLPAAERWSFRWSDSGEAVL